VKLTAVFKPPQAVSVSVNADTMGVTLGTPVVKEYVDVQTYTGEYEVTPSAETQTLNTEGLRLTRNVTVNPIPQNYGLITYNGAVLTVQ
jgi:hypothetical protein